MPIRSVRGGYGEALVVGSQISGKRGEDILIVETRRMQKINSIWLLTMHIASWYIARVGVARIEEERCAACVRMP